MVEGTNHCCDIAERRTLHAPLAKRATGLAFEIDDDEVFAGKEQLTETKIAMATNAPATDATRPERLKSPQHVIAFGQRPVGQVLNVVGQPTEAERQIVQRPLLRITHRLIQR